ncbi:MAG: hypothetical protein MHM6MM_008384 [Cercozoa sp. M6MM]
MAASLSSLQSDCIKLQMLPSLLHVSANEIRDTGFLLVRSLSPSPLFCSLALNPALRERRLRLLLTAANEIEREMRERLIAGKELSLSPSARNVVACHKSPSQNLLLTSKQLCSARRRLRDEVRTLLNDECDNSSNADLGMSVSIDVRVKARHSTPYTSLFENLLHAMAKR